MKEYIQKFSLSLAVLALLVVVSAIVAIVAYSSGKAGIYETCYKEVYKEGYEKGYEKGYNEGKKAGYNTEPETPRQETSPSTSHTCKKVPPGMLCERKTIITPEEIGLSSSIAKIRSITYITSLLTTNDPELKDTTIGDLTLETVERYEGAIFIEYIIDSPTYTATFYSLNTPLHPFAPQILEWIKENRSSGIHVRETYNDPWKFYVFFKKK